MMLAALKLTLSPSIASASCLAVSSQRSARAGEAANTARNANAAASKTGRRNCRRDVMCEGPFAAIEAKREGECKGAMPLAERGNEQRCKSATVAETSFLPYPDMVDFTYNSADEYPC